MWGSEDSEGGMSGLCPLGAPWQIAPNNSSGPTSKGLVTD